MTKKSYLCRTKVYLGSPVAPNCTINKIKPSLSCKSIETRILYKHRPALIYNFNKFILPHPTAECRKTHSAISIEMALISIKMAFRYAGSHFY